MPISIPNNSRKRLNLSSKTQTKQQNFDGVFTRMNFQYISAIFVNSPEFHLATTTIIGRRSLHLRNWSGDQNFELSPPYSQYTTFDSSMTRLSEEVGLEKKELSNRGKDSLYQRTRNNHISPLNNCRFSIVCLLSCALVVLSLSWPSWAKNPYS